MRFSLIVLTLSLVAYPALADDKCASLVPTNAQGISEEFRGKAEGDIQGIISRLAGGKVKIDGEYRKIVTDELNNYPESDKIYVWQRIIYLACINPEIKIDINHLLELYINGPSKYMKKNEKKEIKPDTTNTKNETKEAPNKNNINGNCNNFAKIDGGQGNTISNTISCN